MRTFIKVSAILSVAALVVLALPAANATCGATSSRSYGTYPSYFGGCDGLCEITGLSTADPTQLESAWWKLNNGNSALGAGIDNGAHMDDSTGGTGAWIYGTGDGNNIIIGGGGANTDAGATDGCPDLDGPATPDTLIFYISDPTGKVAIISATQNGDNYFDVDGCPSCANTDVASVALPALQVQSSNKVDAANTSVTVAGPSLAQLSAAYRDNTNGLAPLASVVTGYRVHGFVVPRNTTAPSDRRRSTGWTALTPAKVNIGSPATVNINCPTNCDAYLGYSLVFDGATNAFETGSVSAQPRLVQAGPTLAQPGDPDFRVIKRSPNAPPKKNK
jgi:hypothetical protein